MKLTEVPSLPNGRPETGPMQFGDDWPGVFIRGDNALFYAKAVESALRLLPESSWSEKAMLNNLMNDLKSCSVGDTGWPPHDIR